MGMGLGLVQAGDYCTWWPAEMMVAAAAAGGLQPGAAAVSSFSLSLPLFLHVYTYIDIFI